MDSSSEGSSRRHKRVGCYTTSDAGLGPTTNYAPAVLAGTLTIAATETIRESGILEWSARPGGIEVVPQTQIRFTYFQNRGKFASGVVPESRGSMDHERCKLCGAALVPPYGNPKAFIGIVGEFPGYEEIRAGVPFVGSSGRVLREELLRVELDLREDCWVTNLWQHAVVKDTTEQKEHAARMLRAMKRQPILFLLGSDVSKFFFDKNVTDICGMRGLKSNLAPGKVLVVAVNPANLLRRKPIGDFRDAIELLGKEHQKLKRKNRA